MSAPFLTPLKRIATPKGDVMHGLKAGDPGYAGFGEAYFSLVNAGETKGWKRHFRMTLNLVCAAGRVRVVVRGEDGGVVLDTQLSPDATELYNRLTVPPGYFVAFKGLAPGASMLLNVASIPHDPDEAETRPTTFFGGDL
ncbi:dTDP-4-dehydrorhamnose 3,5-epimerase [Shinella sp. BYT-45]|uniref:dTDP-4-dehydrorhamnose 3,5-epimerase n=1 Tax=Shinella sp. BYT-45 TaxID=3377377 RepID=UPI00397FE12C